MKKSAEMLGTEFPIKKLRVLIQTEGAVISQKPLTGRHEKIETKRIANPQAITYNPTIFVRIANPRPGNGERYRRRIEILIMGKVML